MRPLAALLLLVTACLPDVPSSSTPPTNPPTSTPPTAPPMSAASITNGPFTISLDRAAPHGTFASGDPWIHLPAGETLTITAVTASGTVGAMLNPSDPTSPAFHPSMSGAPALAATFPLTITADGGIDSLVVALHGTDRLIERYAIITIVPTVPPRNGVDVLRPGATGPRDTKRWFDLATTPIDSWVSADAPAIGLADAESIYQKICRASDYDYFLNISGGQVNQASYNSGGVIYGAYKAAHRTALFHRAVDAATSVADRHRYLACLLQMGADVHQNMRFGGMSYREGGGQGHGRWLPLALLAAATRDDDVEALASEGASPRPVSTMARGLFEEFDHHYYSATLDRVLYGDIPMYGWTYDCFIHSNCVNPPQASYWSIMDPHEVIDGGMYGDSYFSTIESAFAIAIDAAHAIPAVDALVDARMRDRASTFALEGFRTQPDPYASERPSQAQYHGTRNYDGQLDINLVRHFVTRLGAPSL